MNPGRGAASLLRRGLGHALIAIGFGLLCVIGLVGTDVASTQLRLGARLERLKESRTGPGLARSESRESGLVGRIVAESVGLEAMVLEGTSDADLIRGVGHVRASALPGEPGNVVLAGHRDTFFRSLRSLGRGDIVAVDTPSGVFEYRVDSLMVVRPSRADLMNREGEDRLTLVTCYPFHWIGPAPMRYVVLARPVDTRGFVAAAREGAGL